MTILLFEGFKHPLARRGSPPACPKLASGVALLRAAEGISSNPPFVNCRGINTVFPLFSYLA
jgi:hypothetical protein